LVDSPVSPKLLFGNKDIFLPFFSRLESFSRSVGNVAAGSIDIGFWLELKDKTSNQLNNDSFMDNSAHSSFTGLLTYQRGWLPSEPAVMKNFKTYSNQEGCKFHITGNLTFKNALLSDNTISVRYGAWNEGITFEDSLFLGLSQSQRILLGKTCPPAGGCGIRASMNGRPGVHWNLALKNTIFSDFTCGSETIKIYDDGRMFDDMGDPVQSDNVSIINSSESNKPKLEDCSASIVQNWFMEDFDATLGPETKGPGFLIRDHERTKAFLPEGSCEALTYDAEGCTAFCEGVCLRLVHLMPTGRVTIDNTAFDKLQLTDLTTGISETYTLNAMGEAILALPAGQYDGEFLDGDGNPLTVDTVDIEAFREPRCSNYITEADFSFTNTASPTTAPTATPTASPSAAPTVSPTTAPTAESTKYYDKSYVLSGTNHKCPSEGRLFKSRSINSVEECHEQCFNMPGCNFFSYLGLKRLYMTCSLENDSYLGDYYESEAYELTSIKPPSDFGYELWDGKGIGMKCPSTSDRINKIQTSTRTECYQSCKETTSCGWFSYNQYTDWCLLCQSDGGMKSSSSYNTYEMLN
jgi:hypothetical protein